MQMSSGGVVGGGGGGGGGSKVMSPKQVLTVVLVVFCALSFVKLLLLTGSSSPAAAARRGRASAWGVGGGNGTDGGLAPKEAALLRSVVAARAPCRLLVFGLSPQLAALAAVNAGEGAATAFVTDSAEDADSARRSLRGGSAASAAAAAKIHQVRYRDAAGEAWPLLRRARDSPACRRPTGAVGRSGCHLALTATLPREVLDARWDVLVVDGPSGAAAGEPGRMGAIYTAAALARASAAGGREAVDVAVHDVHRTVERWYAWEYLCEDNLAAAKGRLWHFRVAGGGPPDAFCPTGPAQIL
ncbi:probable methyltransferase At1g27930 [Oryza glaberrima]|uniref:probable methyltransferase At1g27930 n=1 Tax=Oryza glaberrima TaxID=4538 RepID=UPI00224BFA6B|nr:probable methyltransferase At1g27930 [Oryza glaberrima]